MDAGLRDLLSEPPQLNPRPPLPPTIHLQRHASIPPGSADTSPKTRNQPSTGLGMNSREDVGASPGRRVLNVIVPRHMLRNDGNRILRVPREEEGARQPDDTRSAPVSFLPRRSNSADSPKDNDGFRHLGICHVTPDDISKLVLFSKKKKMLCVVRR